MIKRSLTAEKERQQRIDKGKPGSPCTEKYLVSNTEFTKEPICTASRKYQKLKLEQLAAADLPKEEYELQVDDLLSKECLCIGLSNSAGLNYKVPIVEKLDAVTICPGPNIANFSKVASLQEMTDHIYGRRSLPQDVNRPHMFIKELQLYVAYIKEEIKTTFNPGPRDIKGWKGFCTNLLDGMNHYRELLEKELIDKKEAFSRGLKTMELEVLGVLHKLESK